MPEYLSPGVYIEEVNTGPRPIEAVATSVAAFVGFAPYSNRKEANRPVLITSWTQYVEHFGKLEPGGQRNPHIDGAFMSHAVYGFFLNGGTRCYVTRVVPPDLLMLPAAELAVPTALTRDTTSKATALTLKVRPEMLHDEDIVVAVERTPGSPPNGGAFTVRVRKGDVEEPPAHVQLDAPAADSTPPAEGDAAPTGVTKAKSGGKTATKDLLGGASRWVTVEAEPGKAPVAERMPALGVYVLGVPQPDPQLLTAVDEQHIVGDVADRSGIVGLEIAEDVTMVCCPDLMSPLAYKAEDRDNGRLKLENVRDRLISVQKAMINHCTLAGGRMALLDAPPDLSPQEVEVWKAKTASFDSMHAALYYPWITIANPLAASGKPATIDVPPCGHIAGVFARSDSERGVHKAPANEEVRGALRAVRDLTKGEQDGLNPIGVNCIRAFPSRGIRVWGARTLSSDPAWRYVNVRRLFNMVEKSIERSTQWVVFEPNDAGLWSRVRRDVGAFLTTLWRDGMLFGDTPQQAFYVKCDEEINPPESRDLGRLIIEVGMAPVKPAEFVIFRFSQYAGGGA